jgi:hypothetical protein
MIKDSSDPFGLAYSGVGELQLSLTDQDDFESVSKLPGRKVSVSGKLTPRVTAYHETNVLLMVERLTPLTPTEALYPRSLRPSPVPLADMPSYFVSVTVLPSPVSRVVKQAWAANHPTRFFSESDRYAQHMFNGPEDIMWVKCREGYTISAPRSTTKAGIFQMSPDSTKNPYWGVAVSDSQPTNITMQCIKVAGR